MILEEETYKRFGYYSADLSPQSGKRIVAACNMCGKIREITKHKYRDLCLSCSHKTINLSPEARHNMSEAGKRKNLSEEHKRRIGDSERGEKHHLFGKHRSEEVRRKISEATSGENNHNYGKHRSEETRKKISEKKKGENHHFYGKHFSEEHKRKLSEALKGEKNPLFGKHPSEETRKKMSIAHTCKTFPTHHTRPEMIYEEICKKYNLQYKYTGDGAFWIGKGPAINPDFVNCNGKKIAVEIFSYWHDPIRRFGKVRYSHTYEGRNAILKQYGWKLIVFWQEDLEREDAEAFVLSTLKREGGM